jgi:dTDP-4-dehydrorhamnose 3,5-epimerase
MGAASAQKLLTFAANEAGTALPARTCHAESVDVQPLTDLPDVWRIRPRVHRDDRGFFVERWRQSAYRNLGLPDLVQDNHSRSVRWALRGLHFQGPPHAQGKLVSVVSGRIFDVAVDLREGSPTYGRWAGALLAAPAPEHLWIPPGFAHGFLVLSASADVLYKSSAEYAPAAEGGVAWDDPDVAVRWPLPPGTKPLVSPKDAALPRLAEFVTPFGAT